MKPDDRENQEDARRLPNFKKIEKESSRSSRHPIDAARPAPRGSTDPPLLRIPAESESGVDLSRQKQVGKNLSAPRLARSKSRTVAEDSANTTCSVCLNIISDSAVAENCMHQFCRSCIVEWARRSNLCPVCRTSFSNIIANIRSDREFETIPVEQPSATTYNIVREVTVSRDGRNATVRTRYSLGNDVQELTEVRDLDRSREAIDPRPELNRNSLFDVFFRDVMNDQYDGGFRFPHNPTLRGPVRIPSIPGFLSIVPPSIEPLVFPMDPRAPSTSNRPPSAQNIGPGRALSPHYSASLRRSPSIPQIPSVPYVFIPFQGLDGSASTSTREQLNPPPSSETRTSHHRTQQGGMQIPGTEEFQHSFTRFKKSRDSVVNSNQDRSESSEQPSTNRPGPRPNT